MVRLCILSIVMPVIKQVASALRLNRQARKIWLALVCCSLFAATSSAQDISYFKSYGANFGEQGNDVAYLDDHTVATALQLSDPGGGGIVYPGLLLTDEAGEKLFCKKYENIPPPSGAEHIIPNQDGFLLVGSSVSGAWMMQADPLGEVLWAQILTVGLAMHITDVLPVDGGYQMVGTTRPTSVGYPEIITIKVDHHGQVLWSKQIETDNFHLGNLRIVQHEGDFFIAGSGKLESIFLDVFLMRLDSLATPLWTKHFDSTYDDELVELIQDGDGNLFLVGRNYHLQTQWDAFLLKVTPDGERLTTKHYDANGRDEQMRCATLLGPDKLALSFDHGGSGDRSPAVLLVNTNTFQQYWCKTYVYEAQFTNYVLALTSTPDQGMIMVGNMHIIGKIRDTYLVRTLFNGDAGCHTLNYPILEVSYTLDDSLVFDTSHDELVVASPLAVVAEEAPEIVEFSSCVFLDPVSNFHFTQSAINPCESNCYKFHDDSRLNPTEWQWTFEGGQPSSFAGQDPPVVCWTTPGEYTVTLKVSSSAGASIYSQPVLVDLHCSPIIPNVFSPNEDGRNDGFEILNLPSSFQLTIFNRWGNEVFESTEASRLWQGLNDATGQPVPEGVYYYEFTDRVLDRKSTGHVQLLR